MFHVFLFKKKGLWKCHKNQNNRKMPPSPQQESEDNMAAPKKQTLGLVKICKMSKAKLN